MSLNGEALTGDSIPINEKIGVQVQCLYWKEYELQISNRWTFEGGNWKEAADADQTIGLEPQKYQLVLNEGTGEYETEFVVVTPGEFKITLVSLVYMGMYIDKYSSNDFESSFDRGYLYGNVHHSGIKLWSSTSEPWFEKTYFYLKGPITGDVEMRYQTSVFGSLYIDGTYRFTSVDDTQLITTASMTENEYTFLQYINTDGGDRFSKFLQWKYGSMADFENVPNTYFYAINYADKIEMDLVATCPTGMSEIETDGFKSWSISWGDGQVHFSEEWDVGNTNGDAGWSATWEVIDGWAWTTDSPSVCTQW